MTAVLTAVLTAAMCLVGTGPAGAAAPATTTVCGSGYTIVADLAIGNGHGLRVGELHVFTHTSGSRVTTCAVTVHYGSFIGKRLYTAIDISDPAGHQTIQAGDFTVRAGPVYAQHAPAPGWSYTGFINYGGKRYSRAYTP